MAFLLEEGKINATEENFTVTGLIPNVGNVETETDLSDSEPGSPIFRFSP